MWSTCQHKQRHFFVFHPWYLWLQHKVQDIWRSVREIVCLKRCRNSKSKALPFCKRSFPLTQCTIHRDMGNVVTCMTQISHYSILYFVLVLESSSLSFLQRRGPGFGREPLVGTLQCSWPDLHVLKHLW